MTDPTGEQTGREPLAPEPGDYDQALAAVAEGSALQGPVESGKAVDVRTSGSDEAILASSAVMTVGTVVSRISGVLRGAALAAAVGYGLLGNVFALGNTLPNIVYILVIGGALNAVFVPQLVRHMKHDTDAGNGFADRLMTLVGVAMLLLTAVTILAAPWIVDIYKASNSTAAQDAMAVSITRYCLPQIFFYGVYTMLSQVLNARGHFAAPMFAPIANNVVSVIAFGSFFFIWGTGPAESGTLTSIQTAVLGLGATLGVAAQAVVLVPYVRRSGYHWRPRFDWRGVGLRHAGALASWTIGLVLVNQLAYIVIVRLLNSAGGLFAYQSAHLVFILPHSIITVSLVTALLPRMSHAVVAQQWHELAGYVASGSRTAAAAVLPAAAVLVVLGPKFALLLFGYGATTTAEVSFLGVIISIFALGLLPFTLFYLVLRGWYALEATRTAFWVTVVLNLINLVLAIAAYQTLTARGFSTDAAVYGIAGSYVVAYWITAALAWRILSRRLGGLQTARTLRSMIRMAIAALLTYAVMTGVLAAMRALPGTGKLMALLDVVVVGSIGLLIYGLVARVLHISEVTEVAALVRRRLPGRSSRR